METDMGHLLNCGLVTCEHKENKHKSNIVFKYQNKVLRFHKKNCRVKVVYQNGNKTMTRVAWVRKPSPSNHPCIPKQCHNDVYKCA